MVEKPQRQTIKKQQPVSYVAEAAATAEKETKKGAEKGVTPSRRRRRVVREQVSTRILAEIRDAADEYMDDTGATFQGLVEIALTEYLEKAGYTVGSGR